MNIKNGLRCQYSHLRWASVARRIVMLFGLAVLVACQSEPGGDLGDPAAAPQPTSTVGDGYVSITWAPVSGATRYRLYFLSAPSAASAVAAPVQEVTSPALIDGLQNGRAYHVALTSVAEGGESEYSEVLTVVPRPAPEAPQEINVSTAAGAITLGWSSVSTADAYKVYILPTDGAPATDFNSAPFHEVPETASPTYTEQNLINGREYAFVVKALNSSGESAPSTVIKATPGPYKSLSAGAGHTCVVDAQDAMWCWGDNKHSQLDGVESSKFSATPRRVVRETKWKFTTTGPMHTCGVGQDASLQCWGNNSERVVTIASSFRQPVPLDAQWFNVSGGLNRACAARGDGSLHCWGVGTSAETRPIAPVSGDADWLESVTTVSRICARKRNNTVWCMAWPNLVPLLAPEAPQRIEGLPPVLKLSAYGLSSKVCAIDTARKLWCWDEVAGDPRGQLGRGTVATDAQPARVDSNATWFDVSLGADHACGIQEDGSLWCWGANDYGQLGLDVRADQLTPVRTGADSQWSRVVAGARHTCAMKQDGSVWCVGRNEVGQLGTGASAHPKSPQHVLDGVDSVATSSVLACAILTNRQTWCWGKFSNNDETYLSDTITPVVQYGQARVPVLVDDTLLFKRIFRAREGICGIADDGALWCWGDSVAAVTTGQVLKLRRIADVDNWEQAILRGTGTTVCTIRLDVEIWCASSTITAMFEPTVPTWTLHATGLSPWRELSPGIAHVCALNDAGEIWCWGGNSDGQIGSVTVGISAPKPVQVTSDRAWLSIATGSHFNCAIAVDHTLWCWGSNKYGQSGQHSSVVNKLGVPTQVGVDADWSSVNASFQRTCATKQNGTLWCMGMAPGDVEPGNSVEPGEIELLHEIPRVNPNQNWASGVASRLHNCALTTEKALYCWGMNDQGQAGNGQAWSTEWQAVNIKQP